MKKIILLIGLPILMLAGVIIATYVNYTIGMMLLLFFIIFIYGLFIYSIIKMSKDKGYKAIIHVIPQGKHYSRPKLLRLKYINKKKIHHYSAMFEFTQSCLYPIKDDTDREMVNKLWGVSFNLFTPHKNSVRIGWNPSPYNEMAIRLYAYVYIDGVRSIEYITTVNTDKKFDVLINIIPEYYINANNERAWKVDIEIFYADINENMRTFIFRNINKIGYICNPYHGGERTAPQEEVIYEF